jgi:hypothetical protein
VLGLTVVLGGAAAGPAGAVNVFTLDTNPAAGFAAVALDSAGTGYFAWQHKDASTGNPVPMFCKVARGGTCANPILLPTAPVGFGGGTAADAAFPVLGSGQTVYVVGPRFIQQDVVVWTSTDGGVTFGAATKTTQSGVSEGSDPTDVLAPPSGGFYISSHNPGLAFTGVPASGVGLAPVTDLSPPGGTANAIGDSTLGLAGGGTFGNPVEAWTMFTGGQPFTVNFRSATGDPNSLANWSATSQVSTGKLSSLAGGPSGLFLASQDIDAAGHYTQVNVRKYTPGSGFGTPVKTLQTDTSSDNGGRIFQTPGGRVLVAWQGPPRADNGVAIRLYDSTTTGGASFTKVGDVAEGTPGYAIVDFRVAAADDGQGFVSFREFGGGNTFLRVADLTPIKSATTTVTSLTTAGQAPAAKLTVGPGTPITDTATIQGPAGATATGATGTVAYNVYSDAGCTALVRTAGTTTVSGGVGAASLPISLAVGTWYYQAQYSGDAANLPSKSACGAEVVTVAPASVGVAGIIFVGGTIVINGSFNTSGSVIATTQVTNVSALRASSAKKKAKRCKAGQVLAKVGKKKKCVSNSFGTSTTTIPAAGRHEVRIPANALARKALAKGKALHVKVTLTFKPTAGGTPAVTNANVTAKGKKKHKKH